MNLSLEHKLEAHPITSNQQLLNFNIRSRGINWKKLITPLRQRNIRSCRYLGRDFNYMNHDIGNVNESNRREILVCHDMMGNYLEDRYYGSSKKWDSYRFYHWPGIDYFCYFSHNYITIPPCGWTNAAHMHGVKMLGTFITEGKSGSKQILEVLESVEKIQQVCDALVRICEHFCFEGWLINIECDIPADKIDNLIFFMNTLRTYTSTRIPDGVVFWYDSVVHHGTVLWQNEINDKNVRFFNNSDGMLINYNWTDSHLQTTQQTVNNEFASNSKVFFGIDVFGRGQIAKYQTHQTLARIVQSNFSVGIFAPGWTFEGLSNFGYNIRDPFGQENVNDAFLQRNEKFWSLLWQYVATHAYDQMPFYTDFCLGSGYLTFNYGNQIENKFFNLSRQSLQPSVPLLNFAERNFNDAVNGGSCLQILKCNESFRLFCTNFYVEKSIIFAYAFKLKTTLAEFDMILKFCDLNEQNDYFLMCGDYNNTTNIIKERVYLSPIGVEHYSNISQIMSREYTPLKLPFNLSNDWKVRYYGISFDRPIIVKDIGLLYRKSINANKDATLQLGAVYLNSFKNVEPITNWVNVSNQFFVNPF